MNATSKKNGKKAQMAKPAAGIWAPAVTPLDTDLMPDHQRAIAHMRWLLDSGCHGIAYMGTTSEATSFSVGERIALLDAALEAGIAPDRLMVGSGCAALSDSVALTRHATKAGCKVLVLPPFYYKDISDDGLYASYAALIDRVGDDKLQLFFYHFPKLSAVPITHAVIKRLMKDYPKVIKGLKDSSGDPEGCAAFIEAFPDLSIFPGTETLLLSMLERGGAGTITASANINPGAIRKVYDAWATDDSDMVALQEKITTLRLILQRNAMVPTLKAALANELEDDGWLRVRPPLTMLGAAAKDDLISALNGFGFSIEKPSDGSAEA
jgi:4-hydroxy-tetrahydrodipicolinate synthase